MDSILPSLRVLDFSDERGFLCGKLLGSMGADVVKIEPPGGDPARRRSPFAGGIPDPDKSLYWKGYNTSKRSITLNLDSPAGRDLFLRLVEGADILVECFPPGHLARQGLGFADLRQRNPGLIMASITPFGQTGPYAGYAGNDLVAWAMGGFLYPTGDPAFPPVRVAVEQAYPQAGAQAAMGILMAYHQRHRTGQGQHVDISMQECLAAIEATSAAAWRITQQLNHRTGGVGQRGRGVRVRSLWPCQDGYIAWRMFVGIGLGHRTGLVAEWMTEAGFHHDMADVDWEGTDLMEVDQESLDHWEDQFIAFFKTRTKEDLKREALRRGVWLYPVQTSAEVLADEQLAFRGYFVPLEDDTLLDRPVRFPGAFWLSNRTALTLTRAPRVGEHDEVIYCGELGLSAAELRDLQATGVV